MDASPTTLTTAVKVKPRLTEANLIDKGHTHIVPGTLRFDILLNKQVVKINTRGLDGCYDGNTREVATSDLHQVFHTTAVKAQLDKIKLREKRKDRKSAHKSEAEALRARIAELEAERAGTPQPEPEIQPEQPTLNLTPEEQAALNG
jgi:hypothetical protein